MIKKPCTVFLLDSLYCKEDYSDEEEEGNDGFDLKNNETHQSVLSLEETQEQEQELVSLLSKEKESCSVNFLDLNSDLVASRTEAVEWMLKIGSHYSFSNLTVVTSVSYFDRFVASFNFQKDKPWMGQLASIACLSLAAKMEETQVPLLLDLQVEESKYLFEAKMIRRMELLILSTLDWKMKCITPLSFVDHIIRRVGLKTPLNFEFLRKCEDLLLSAIADSRFTNYLPSVLAASTVIYVIQRFQLFSYSPFESQILDLLNSDKEQVDNCIQFMLESSFDVHKRKRPSTPNSPTAIVDSCFSHESSNDSWRVSSPKVSLCKKKRPYEEQKGCISGYH